MADTRGSELTYVLYKMMWWARNHVVHSSKYHIAGSRPIVTGLFMLKTMPTHVLSHLQWDMGNSTYIRVVRQHWRSKIWHMARHSLTRTWSLISILRKELIVSHAEAWEEQTKVINSHHHYALLHVIMALSPDIVLINRLRINSKIGTDRWGKVREQPIFISIQIEVPLEACCRSDNVADSIHYGHLAKDVTQHVEGSLFSDLGRVAESVADLVLAMDPKVQAVEVQADAPNQFLLASSLSTQLQRTQGGNAALEVQRDKIRINGLRLGIIIGVNPPERIAKQIVLVDITFHAFTWSEQDWNTTHATLVEVILFTSFQYSATQSFISGNRVDFVSYIRGSCSLYCTTGDSHPRCRYSYCVCPEA